MPLPLPILDTRTFDQLVDEGRGIIPSSAPAWTDFNWHDPGITLVDLFAWLTEQDIYRLDRTTEEGFRSFLRLLGVRPHPSLVADTILTFSVPNPSPVGAAILPAGVQVGNTDGRIVFQTTEGLRVSPAHLVAVLSGADQTLVDHSSENGAVGGRYMPLGPQPSPGNALYLGFDGPLADQLVAICLYVWAREVAADKETRGKLITEWNAAREDAKNICPHGVSPDVPDWRMHYGARVVWEYYAQPGEWKALSGLIDETRALTLSGPVRFTAPPKDQHIPGGPNAAAYAGLYFIRCRLLSGSYECPPNIRRIAVNGIRARHAADVNTLEDLGASSGQAHQTFQLRHKPIVPGSTAVHVGANQGVPETKWKEELVWDQVGPHAKAYVLLPETGEIVFGDGRVGRVPPDGVEITAKYRVGGGAVGNVAAESLTVALANAHNQVLIPSWNVLGPKLKTCQPFGATGGADAEPLSEAMGRAFASLSRPYRGVTLSDFESLARATPGVPVASAYAIPDYDPAFPCFPALGAVTIVVLPQCPDSRPQPSPGFLKAVARYIERRRTITTEVHVVGPTYMTVSVSARLNVQLGVNSQNLIQLSQSTLADFLNPLHGGPNKKGWPAGRDVYRSDILALLNALPGVVFVDELTLQADAGPAIGCDNLGVCRHVLVASGQHHVTVSTWRGK